VRVDGWTAGGAAFLGDLLEGARIAGIPSGHGSARRSSLRSYGPLIDALDEVRQRHPDLIQLLPLTLRDEIEGVLAGGMPGHRQRWVLAVRELLVASCGHRGGLVLVLDGLDHADLDTVDAVEWLGQLTRHHPIVVAVGVRNPGPALAAFEHRPTDPGPDTVPPPPSLPDDAAEALRLARLLAQPFDLETLTVALAAPVDTCLRFLDVCEQFGLIDHAGSRFALVLDRLPPDGTSPHRRRADHRLLAGRLVEGGGAPHQIAHHLMEGGELRRSVPYVIDVVGARIEAGLHREALGWIDSVLLEANGVELGLLHAWRGDALLALGDPAATAAYRQAVRFAEAERIPGLRARLARAALVTGDLASAAEALAGIEPTGTGADAEILLVQGMLAYFQGDLDSAERSAETARDLALRPGAPARLLDAITLQGMVAHSRGQWHDRLFRELRHADRLPEVAATVFDCHVCVAEYLLYGPTPYTEVVELATRLRLEAERLGAQRAVAFAVCVCGEAELLAGRLDEARVLLQHSVELHRHLAADTGLAHSLQRLAEVHLADAEPARAERLAREALALARWSPLSHHLLQRIYGTLIAAALDPAHASAVVDEATQVLDATASCEFCLVMFAAPAAIACAEAGRLQDAERHLHLAETSASLWQGTAWQGAVREAGASLQRARGEAGAADRLLHEAAEAFDLAGQPLDAERCRDAISAPA
jgi:tetratricopeptide (TPR) repeat protein